jgi:hypothetical protein
MRTYFKRILSSWIRPVLSISASGVILCCATAIQGQVFPAYSFEPDLQGFVGNPAGPAITVSLETSGLGATVGQNSMKVALADFTGFAGPQTPTLHPAFSDPAGLDFIRFDLTNTNRYVPPDPVPGTTPTFADVSVLFEGEFASAPGTPAQIQFYPLAQVAIGDLEPGTHEVEISLQIDENQPGTGGLWVQGGEYKSWTDWINTGYTPFSFEIYINKNVRVLGGPTWAWTVYIDNIRLVREVELPGDFNEDLKVDAADYVVWRQNELANAALPNDNGLATQAERFDLWRSNFGNMPMPGSGSASAVPEPAGASLLLAAACGWATKRRFCVRRQLAKEHRQLY